ncbi:hypothetical protein RhiirA1_458530 [Rhizophagus irregularis]|uniref:Uncharacterized protein n=1 Tax=Rhizophagus irregularis TaxID=588596 RepID=A0A2N0RVM2_9GLOM|nr:hypothetical protein RhiirA1_458530 [Rhizophagus irregularis]
MYTPERIYCSKADYHIDLTENIVEDDAEVRRGVKEGNGVKRDFALNNTLPSDFKEKNAELRRRLNLRTDSRKRNWALRWWMSNRTTGGIAVDAPVIDAVERSEDWFNNASSAENEQ